MAAKVRQACPEAAYVGVAYPFHSSARELELLGVLGQQTSPLSGLPWLWETGDEEHPLAEIAVEIETDVQTALEPYDSPVRANVQPDSASEGNLWLVELPPPDRAARIAQLVRDYHRQATAVVVDGRRGGGRAIEVIEGVADDGTAKRTQPRWSRDCDETLTRLVAQIFAVPALADRHLVPTGGRCSHPYGSAASDLLRLMPLPPTA
ncbi:hypothetical protein [Streptomyces bluensis]|uniref:hypothetical protein n=1 Tax=Streptomyces bluensis TaxID=33897 RepID=UPI003323B8C4